MTREEAWEVLMAWSEAYDDRSVSDEAREWADSEAKLTARPENDGEWRASLETAFDAGRKYQQLRDAPGGER